MTEAGRGRSLSARAMVTIAMVAPLVPMVVALLARRHPPWVPDLDLALTELRVRDVGGPHTPLVGLPGRIGTLARQGSHPGPLSFYLLAPTYRLLGATAFALQAATVLLHAIAVVVTVGLVGRRAGARWALGTGLALTAYVGAVGPSLFTEPWNPHLPLLWWPAFLAAVWCALAGDRRALLVVALAGAICAQTHVSYLGPVAVLTVVAAAVAVWRPGSCSDRRTTGPWLAAAALLLVVLWTPTIADQMRHDPGNLTLLGEHLLDPPEAPLGGRTAARLVLEHLDVVHLARSSLTGPGALGARYPVGASAVRGAALLVAAGAAAALRRRRSAANDGAGVHGARPADIGGRDEAAGQALAGLAVALVGLAVSRIFGVPWGYLLLVIWPVSLVLVLVVAAGLASGVARHAGGAARIALPLTAVLALVVSGRASAAAWDAEATNPVVSRTVLALVPEVVAALDLEDRYLVSWDDAIHLGGHGYGMVVELERRGVRVAVSDGLATQFGRHRRVAAGPIDAELVVATGLAIDRWAAVPGSVELARADTRTSAERSAAADVRAELLDVLRAAGLVDLVPTLDDNLLAVAFDPRLPTTARNIIDRLDRLGAPAAVFLVVTGSPRP